MTRSFLRAILCLVCVLGCSKAADKPRSEIFENVNRAAKAIEGSADIGLDHPKFQTLLSNLSTELHICQDKVKSDAEKKVLGLYSDALDTYKASDTLWKLKLALPELRNQAHNRWMGLSRDSEWEKESTEEKTKRKERAEYFLSYKLLCFNSEVHPLTDCNGRKTEAADVAEKFGLSKTTVDGWECIDGDSIQVLWQKAAEKVKEANSLLN